MKDGFRVFAMSENYVLMNHAWKISGVSKSPVETVVNETIGASFFTFDMLTESEDAFELVVQVTNPATITTGNLLVRFFKRWDNEKLAELTSFVDCFETKTKDIEGNALSLSLGWGNDSPDGTDGRRDDAYGEAAAFPQSYVYITPTSCTVASTDCEPVQNQLTYTFSIPTTNSANTHITDSRIPASTNLYLEIPTESNPR